jgi:hypothetical protein
VRATKAFRNCAKSTIHRYILQAGFIFKQRSKIWNADAPDVMAARLEGCKNMQKYFSDPKYILVFFDEVAFRAYQLISAKYIGLPGERLYVCEREGSTKESAHAITFATAKGWISTDVLIRGPSERKGPTWTAETIQTYLDAAIPKVVQQYGGQAQCRGKQL